MLLMVRIFTLQMLVLLFQMTVLLMLLGGIFGLHGQGAKSKWKDKELYGASIKNEGNLECLNSSSLNSNSLKTWRSTPRVPVGVSTSLLKINY